MTRTGQCIDISSTYDLDDDRNVEVPQSSDCPQPDVVPGVTPGWQDLAEVVIFDGGWHVSATGEIADAESIAAQVTALPFDTSTPEPQGGFDADSYLDDEIAGHLGREGLEVARFDWQGGRVDPQPIELTRSHALPDVRAAFIDLVEPIPFDQVNSGEDIVTVLDPDGTTTPCVQN